VDISRVYFNRRSKENKCGNNKELGIATAKSRVYTKMGFLYNKGKSEWELLQLPQL